MNYPTQCFIEFLNEDGTCSTSELVNHQNTLGRHSSCTIQIGGDDPHVSNRHAVIMRDATGVLIEDLESTNGVFVNGERTNKTTLKHGDIIRLGAHGPQMRIVIEKCPADELPLPAQPVTGHEKDDSIFDVSPCINSAEDPLISPEVALTAEMNKKLQNQSPGSECTDLPPACLVEIVAENGTSSTIELVNHQNTIGRHPSCTVQIGGDDPRVSNRHAVIILDGTEVSIEDPGSTNGVFVNGEKTVKTGLKHNDIIRLGTHGPQLRVLFEKHNSPSSNESPLSLQPRSQENGTTDLDVFDISPASSSVGKSRNNPMPSGNSLQKQDSDQLHAGIDNVADNSLFDVSPNTVDIVRQIASPEINATAEIKRRLQKQIMNTQDIQMLAKNQKMRQKIFNDKNIAEPQKQLITKVTNAYRSMKRTNLIVFGSVIALLFVSSIWFAIGYFNNKSASSKLEELRTQLKKYDEKFEYARTQQGTGSIDMKQLYDSLQKVQVQFDSLKTSLEVRDHHKIHSDTVEAFLDEIMNEFNEKNYCIPPHMLDRVKYYIHQFTNEQRKATEILMRRRAVYFPEIERIFSMANVPKALGYVAMQESLLDTIAQSNAGAVGMWQFMESTGRDYNLTITDALDERKDWRRSTTAAASYFRSLLLHYGDGRGILLAIAAYNAGEQKITKALEIVNDPIKDRDFWYLYRTSSILALETREYVPQVLARVIVDKHPELYGFTQSK